jgi:hypothetical protein
LIIAAALCPWPPLLARELTGHDPVVPQLRCACLEAVGCLVKTGPDLVVVVSPAAATGVWDASSWLDLSVFAPALGKTGAADLPPALGLGAMLLDQSGYAGRRMLQAVAEDEPVDSCAELGRDIAARAKRVTLLVMGDGSARRGPAAPGYLDQRAAAFDAEVERCVRAGDVQALRDIDPVVARELMATGRPGWQVLSGALSWGRPDTEVLYADDPFGVAYLVAVFRPDASVRQRC